MHIRPLEAADIPEVASILADALLDDELWAWLAPNRLKYYSEYRAGFLMRTKVRFSTPGWVLNVAVTDPEDEVGREHRQEHGQGWLERRLLNLQLRYADMFIQNNAIDSSRLRTYASATAGNFPSDIFPELWYVGMLAIHPGYQRMGIGKMLLQWGIEQGTAENVPVGLEPSLKGAGLYKKLGFRDLGTVELMGKEWVAMMVWEPPGLSAEESWFERATEAERKKEEEKMMLKGVEQPILKT
ncbi:conserved hypothetical protein [Histoplasma capsulatum var. duboisii H88]|uniref:N-acetyltransferase domain-containing protein n=2 Tax=Ajellomyces capsulatus (strain H88) TaxID=544711 RepID=F0UF66_AJEC8|nr:conserved hypothetical protein [Histoplasma capsulatum var. duboisii H88]